MSGAESLGSEFHPAHGWHQVWNMAEANGSGTAPVRQT